MQIAILVDDMIDTGHTLTLAANTLHEKGAKAVHVLISHGASVADACYPFSPVLGLLSETNLTLIDQLPIVELVARRPSLNYFVKSLTWGCRLRTRSHRPSTRNCAPSW
jgi:hypothetical protein